GAAEQEASGLFPRETRGLRHALVRLRACELAVAAVVRLVAPDARRLREHRILAALHPWIVRPPPARVHDDLVAGLDVRHVLAGGPHDAGAVAAARVEALGLAGALPFGDHVERVAERGPDVVVVDPRRHHVDEDILRTELRGRDHLALPRVAR